MRITSPLRYLGAELYRRRVLHVGALYIGGYFAGLQGLEPFLGTLGFDSIATERSLAVFTVLALATFPLVLAGAWLYRVSREDPVPQDGSAPETLVDTGERGEPPAGAPPHDVGERSASADAWHTTVMALSLSVLVSVSLAGWLWPRLVPGLQIEDGLAPLDSNGVAILYPESVVGDQETSRFADGLTARLITGLGAVRGLRVPPPAVVQPLRGAGMTPEDIARRLRVATVVTPRVEELGGKLRVTMTIIDGLTGDSRGSVDVTEAKPDRFEIYDQVAESLLTELRTALGRELEMRRSILGTDNPGAWSLFRRATDRAADHQDLLALGNLRGALGALMEADGLLAEAESIDPGFVEATLRRGDFAEVRALLLVPVDSAGHREALAVARSHVDRALGRDPEDPQARALRGRLAFAEASSEWRSATRRKALLDSAWTDLASAVDRHPEPAKVYRTMANVQAGRGETADALQLARRAREYDAFLQVDDPLLRQLFSLSFDLGLDGEAEQWCTEGRRRFPGNWAFWECRLWLLGWGVDVPDPGAAAAVRDSALAAAPVEFRQSLEPWLGTLLAASYARTGDGDSARSMLEEYTASRMSGLSVAAAGVWLLLDDRDEALAWIHRYVEAVPAQAPSLRNFRVLAPLRADPTFQRLTGPDGAV